VPAAVDVVFPSPRFQFSFALFSIELNAVLPLAFSCEQFQGIAHIKRVVVYVGTLRLGAQLICAPKTERTYPRRVRSSSTQRKF